MACECTVWRQPWPVRQHFGNLGLRHLAASLGLVQAKFKTSRGPLAQCVQLLLQDYQQAWCALMSEGHCALSVAF